MRGCASRVGRDAVWHDVNNRAKPQRINKQNLMFIVRSITRRWPLFHGVCVRVVGMIAAGHVMAGCASLTPEQFAGEKPDFNPMAYFTGRTHSWGVFENRAGQPRRPFQTRCVGRMKGGVLLLDQEFTYDDGQRQERHWRIRRVDAHHYEATANDVVGTATGTAYGRAFHWEYTVALKPGDPLFNVRLQQWMYLQEGGRTLLNRGTVRTFGIQVAQITEQFIHD